MDIAEGIRKARKELKMTQKQLADLAGIERKQLSTLERGGNVTLATVRKVAAHLPNLQPFTFGDVVDTVAPVLPQEQKEEAIRKMMVTFGIALEQMMSILLSGKFPDDNDYQKYEDAHRAFHRSIGFTDEEYDRSAAATRAQIEPGQRLTRADAAVTIAMIQGAIARLALNAQLAGGNELFTAPDEPPKDR